MVSGLGVRLAMGVVLGAALTACGSSSSADGAGGTGAASSAGQASGGGSGHSGSATGGSDSATGGSGSGSVTAGTSGSGRGDELDAQKVTLSFSWSTYELRGTTKTPLTCADLGAHTVSFEIGGDNLAKSEKVISSNGEFCDVGHYENYPVKIPSGDYYLTVFLAAGMASDPSLRSLVSGVMAFTVAPGATHVDIPALQLVRIMFPLSWTISKAGSTAACADVGATDVDFQLAQIKESSSYTISWTDPCGATPTDNLVTPGDFELTATLKASGTSLATWKSPERLTFSNESAPSPPPITFEVP